MMSQDRQSIWDRGWKWLHWVLLAYLLLVLPCMGFLPNIWSQVLTLSWGSHTHQHITEQAILRVTMETLRSTKGHNQTRVEDMVTRCFWRAVGEVVRSNAAVDFMSSTRSNPVYHFDSEHVDSAMKMLRQLWTQTLLSVWAKEYQSARHSLGQLLHSMQDFYSHSNWVEMGQDSVYLHLLHPDEPAIPVAQNDVPTCMDCFSTTCRSNLLPELSSTKRDFQLLTTGYFSTYPPKPQGKCSHGGILDSSRHTEAKGGINKDSTSPLFSPHHYLHMEAANLAAEATLAVLRDLRDTVGHTIFLKLFTVKQVPALVFVMDTTGSMFEEITAARLRALSIIQSRASSPRTGPFLLVPFHDPGVGPVYETDDPNEFMHHMENLLALGGGDEPEMCLSAIQLALTHSPPLSDIFVFTDASPKDAHLFDAVKALALEKQSKVTFLLTKDPSHKMENRQRRKRRTRKPLSPDRFALYTSLSSLTGGMTIFTTDSDIHKVSTIVEDNTAADKVTLLRVASGQDVMQSHSFRVDSSIKSVTLHITGNLKECSLTSPSGLRQVLLSEQGLLAELEHFEGLYRIRLLHPIQPGQWSIQVRSHGQITFNVIGDSSVDFLYYFATINNETHPGLARVEGNPVAGVPAFLVLAVTGLAPDQEASFSHVTLIGASGESLIQVVLNSSSSPLSSVEEWVGWMESVPRVPFFVRLSGRDSRGNKLERVSMEMVQPTYVQIQVLSDPRLVPGHTTVVHFVVLNHGVARLFNLTAHDDSGYLYQRGPYSFPVAEQGSLRGGVDHYTPPTAQAGGTVTLTITVRALDSSDSNYAVTYLTVVPLDPDTAPPTCSIAQMKISCPTECNKSNWSISLAVSDRGHSGLAALQLHKGDGILTLFLNPPDAWETTGEVKTGLDQHLASTGRMTSAEHHQHQHHHVRLEKGDPALNISEWGLGSSHPLWVRYTSSCCSTRAEILVWDAAGNMKRCHLLSHDQKELRYKSTESSGTGKPTHSASFSMLLGLLWGLVLLQRFECKYNWM
ncbi:von Willebrand factor A domain-containing protein 7 [Thalassophryne amazonica]|uniref:von Willebrand factor A domain-containing protein 7 n=1 Tax=Thalassophryne amazonica TaxID=390379 RepID=UPI001471C9BE|nr:von Willebrand factor A domain-containing protein 7 [Thalassophryne amazonica]